MVSSAAGFAGVVCCELRHCKGRMPPKKFRGKANPPCVDEEVRIAIQLSIDKFLESDGRELEFPTSLTKTERAYIHRLCPQLGLTSKSKGKKPNRRTFVTKSKKTDSTEGITVFSFGQNSTRVLHSHLLKWPVKLKEKMDLQPRSAKLHTSSSQESFGSGFRPDTSKTSGRLNNGIPQVPVKRSKSDLDSFRKTLPVASMASDLLTAIDRFPVLLICGETGSGKTTQIPQFILDDCSNHGDRRCRIICTQPRRISAVSMAERVAVERGENVGHTVGYQIRLESRVSPRTLLTFCTNGVLLRTLMAGDSSLSTVTHVIVDEVHERDRFCDFLLIKLKQLAYSRSSPRHPKFRLILMSAALDADLFINYFNNCPVINIPGKMYDVKEYYLEDTLQMTGRFGKGVKSLREWEQLQQDSTSGNQNTSDGELSSLMSDMEINKETWRIEAMDQALYSLWHRASAVVDESSLPEGASDPYPQIFHLIQTEDVPVDYRHSETGVTALMASAMHGAIEECEKLILLGADPKLKAVNGWTAADMAFHLGHDDLADILNAVISQHELLNSDESSSCAIEKSADGSVTEMSEEDRKMVAAYQKKFDDSRVDTNLIMELLVLLANEKDEGAILVFLPGYDDIVTLRENIISDEYAIQLGDIKLYVLHSGMQTSSDQKQVFKPPPIGYRKIILSTNIAETAVTIEDVIYVIDSGKVKIKMFEALTSTSTLKSVWISKSSAIQRKGRAGRCRPGVCFHMFSRARYNAMSQFQTAEILRTSLHELCLQAKLLSVPPKKRKSKGDTSNEIGENAESIAEFLSNAPETPSKLMIDNAVQLLKTIDALDPWEDLTELGHHLVDLPIEPRLGKMVLYAVVLKCLDPVLTIACALAYKDPFLLPQSPDERKQAIQCRVKFAAGALSDHICLLRAFQAWQKARSDGWEKAFCDKNYLSPATMQMIIGMRTQLLGQLRAAGFVRARGGSDIRDLNTNSENWAVVKAAICASAHPNVLRLNRDEMTLKSQNHKKVRFHMSSVLGKSQNNKKKCLEALKAIPTNWLVYDELTMPAQHFSGLALARCCTVVTPACISLFSGPMYVPQGDAISWPTSSQMDMNSCDSDSENETRPDEKLSMLVITDWIRLKMEPRLAEMILNLRTKWYSLFLRRIRSPAKPWPAEDEAVLSTIINILSSEDQSHNLLQPSGIGQRPRPMSQEDSSKGFTGSRLKMAKKKAPEPFKSLKCRSIVQYEGMQGRNQGGQMCASFNSTDENTESSPRPTESHLSTPELFGGEGMLDMFVLSILCKSEKNLRIAQRNGIWLACCEEEELLRSAFTSSTKVILLIFFKDMRYLQGHARLSSPGTRFANVSESQNFGWETDDKQLGQELVAYFSLEWLSRQPVEVEEPVKENSQKTMWRLRNSEGQALINKLTSVTMAPVSFMPRSVGINPNSRPFFPRQYPGSHSLPQPNVSSQHQGAAQSQILNQQPSSLQHDFNGYHLSSPSFGSQLNPTRSPSVTSSQVTKYLESGKR